MTEATRKETEEIVHREVSSFSIVVLGYDRDNPGNQTKPEELLEWVQHQRDRSRKIAKCLGAAVLMIVTAIGTAILSKLTPFIIKLLGL